MKIFTCLFAVFILSLPFLTFANHPDQYPLLVLKVKVIGQENLEVIESNQPIRDYDRHKIINVRRLRTGDVFWLIGSARQTDSTWTYQCQAPSCFSGENCQANEYREQNIEECTSPSELTIYPNFIFNTYHITWLVLLFGLFIIVLNYFGKINSKIKESSSLIFLIGVGIILWKIFINSIALMIYFPYFGVLSLISIILFIFSTKSNRKNIKYLGLVLFLLSVMGPLILVLLLIFN